MSIQPYIRMVCALIDAASGACARGDCQMIRAAGHHIGTTYNGRYA
jgi:hypothetical protein